jgi:hypothetical protein
VSCVTTAVSDIRAAGTSEDGASITPDEGVEASTNGAAAGPEEGQTHHRVLGLVAMMSS